MINVRFYINHGALCMRMTGHSAAAPHGEDLICAGASTLAATLADCAALLDRHGKTEGEPTVELRSGFACVKLLPKPECRGEALMMFSTVQLGMSALRRNYPAYIRLKPFDQSELADFSK